MTIPFANAYQDDGLHPPSTHSPIATELTPMFISLGFDDNTEEEGLSWILELLSNNQNPKGLDRYALQPLKASFFMHCGPAIDNEKIQVLWRQLGESGHEIGNHTLTHPDDKVNYNPLLSWMTAEQWQEEVNACNAFLTLPVAEGGIGVGQISGFRAPFMTYNDNTLMALVNTGIRYDVSFPAGITPEQNGTNNYWPHTLEKGSPSHTFAVNGGWKPAINQYPGLWEVPLHSLIIPPDDTMEKYGINYSLRDKIASRVGYFDPVAGKGDNFDWNLYFTPDWGAAGLNENDVVAIYKYNLDLRLAGNRAPLSLGLHSAFYGLLNGEEHFGMPETTVSSRQNVLKRFIDYALSKPEVRFITHNQLIDWMKDPEHLTLCPESEWKPHQVYEKGETAFFQEQMWRARWWTQLEMPGNTDNSSWQLIESCTPNSVQ
ncbi:carbohydrate-binding protein [Photobacterium gaetbulicola]|uniref:Putative polysaccharide deacetylase n=1 Tax=Photobacterium gaetbulicola Gung47 TaxID=658445 RepID=A0A0C5WSW6_9GAMM|nr:polysaccharide deacetylase family protein [Photobacterium gaetbulicola]AJR06115.1 putative polysaccharide deacetylase [Photobacterium gaetbulicola Gung47]PSU02698.1 carbohydrate-binding protein [Photobacterium gaetbulicola]